MVAISFPWRSKGWNFDKGYWCICATSPETTLCDITLRWWKKLIARDVSVRCNKITNKHQEKWEFISLRPSSNDKEEITLIIWCTKTRCYTSSSSGGTRCLICTCIWLLLGVLNILFVTGSNRAMSFLDTLCWTFKHPVPYSPASGRLLVQL